MVKIPTVKIALVCAGLLLLGQPADAAFSRIGTQMRESLLRLMHRYHESRAAAYRTKMKHHESQAYYAKDYVNNPKGRYWYGEDREFIGENLFRAGVKLGGAGLIGYGIVNFPRKETAPYADQIANKTLKLSGATMGLGALLYHPGAFMLATGAFGASYGLYRLGMYRGKAQQAEAPAKTGVSPKS